MTLITSGSSGVRIPAELRFSRPPAVGELQELSPRGEMVCFLDTSPVHIDTSLAPFTNPGVPSLALRKGGTFSDYTRGTSAWTPLT